MNFIYIIFLINKTLIVNVIINSVVPGETSDMVNCTRTTIFTNGFSVTTGINISRIKYPKIIINLCFNHCSTLDDMNTFYLCISPAVTHLRHVPLKTMHSSGHFTWHCRRGRCGAINIANMNAIAVARVSVPSPAVLWFVKLSGTLRKKTG